MKNLRFLTLSLVMVFTFSAPSFPDVPRLFQKQLCERILEKAQGHQFFYDFINREATLDDCWDIYVGEYYDEEEDSLSSDEVEALVQSFTCLTVDEADSESLILLASVESLEQLNDNIDDVLDIYLRLRVAIEIDDVVRAVQKHFRIDMTERGYLNRDDYFHGWDKVKKQLVDQYIALLESGRPVTMRVYLCEYCFYVVESFLKLPMGMIYNPNPVERFDPVVRWLAPDYVMQRFETSVS